MQPRQYLITGATGKTGKTGVYTVRHLINEGNAVRACAAPSN